MPALRAGIDVGGANSDGCASQYWVVASTASSVEPGQAGTSNGSVVVSDVGGMISETPGRYAVSGALTWSR